MDYFAYGSNMLRQRLQERVPSATFLCVARLPGYMLCWHKRSIDGSAKCNAFETGQLRDEVWGVVYSISDQEKRALDQAEGLGHGYREIEGNVIVLGEGITHSAYLYVADFESIDDSLHPYAWYKAYVLEGARQNGLPEEYIGSIESVYAENDPNGYRGKQHEIA